MIIKEAKLQFVPCSKPFYELIFIFTNGKTHEQTVRETDWGEKQMETYCDLPIKSDDIMWFSSETLEEANKRLQRLIGADAFIKVSRRGMRYLVLN